MFCLGRLFEFRSVDLDVYSLVNEGKLFTGYQMWRSGKKDEAHRLLQGAVDPYASYYKGLIYKESAEVELRKATNIYESRSTANVLLNKARDSLYVTPDRLRDRESVWRGRG